MTFNKELIKRARKVNLASFLLAKGEPLIRDGKRFRHRHHDSLVFTENSFYWNSKGIHGNSIDFLMMYYDISFSEAVRQLTDEVFELPKKEFKKKASSKNKFKKDKKRVIAYLCQTRKISYKLVSYLISKKLITVDEHNNAVFKIFDESHNQVGEEKVGTLSNIRFKQINENNNLDYGFKVVINRNKKKKQKYCFFESSIDLLSFWTLYYDKLDSHVLISMMALRMPMVESTMAIYNVDPERIFLCVDNDDAGNNFIKKMQEHYPVKAYQPLDEKDWNDILKNSFFPEP